MSDSLDWVLHTQQLFQTTCTRQAGVHQQNEGKESQEQIGKQAVKRRGT